jgi:hypothetical protein
VDVQVDHAGEDELIGVIMQGESGEAVGDRREYAAAEAGFADKIAVLTEDEGAVGGSIDDIAAQDE